MCVQKVIELIDYPNLFRGEVISFTSAPVGRYCVEVKDPLSNDLVPRGADKSSLGSKPACVTFTLRLCDVTQR